MEIIKRQCQTKNISKYEVYNLIKFFHVSVFILCWSPYIVFDLLQVFGYLPKTQTVVAVATFIQSLTTLNSAANPIIYCLFSTSFCKTVR